MAVMIRNLSVLAYANGFTLWHYKAPLEAMSRLASDGYFDDAADMLAAGDMIMLTAADGGRIVCVAAGDPGVRLAPLG